MWPGSFITSCKFCSQRSTAFVDHSAITTWLNINKKTSYNHTILEGDTLTRLPKQFLWENDSAQKFKDALRSPRIQTLIRDYIAGDTFNENTELSLEKVENILITTAKCCLKITAGKTRKRIKSLSNKKWFDKECRLKRHELRKLANKKHQDPLNTIIREQYHDTLAQYKKLLNSKKNDHYNAKISELEKTADNSDAKTFWQCLKSTDNTRKWEDVPSISKIGYNISTIFIKMNLLTQRSKTFAISYDKMNAMVNTLVL